MLNKNLALALGALTGLVSLVAMVRLVSGAFDRRPVGLRTGDHPAGHGALGRVRGGAGRAQPADPGPRAGGGRTGCRRLVVAWLFVLGPVVALVCSLAAFAVIWVRDWARRGPRGEDRFVRIEELTAEERD
jgi:hypothetical protein